MDVDLVTVIIRVGLGYHAISSLAYCWALAQTIWGLVVERFHSLTFKLPGRRSIRRRLVIWIRTGGLGPDDLCLAGYLKRRHSKWLSRTFGGCVHLLALSTTVNVISRELYDLSKTPEGIHPFSFVAAALSYGAAVQMALAPAHCGHICTAWCMQMFFVLSAQNWTAPDPLSVWINSWAATVIRFFGAVLVANTPLTAVMNICFSAQRISAYISLVAQASEEQLASISHAINDQHTTSFCTWECLCCALIVWFSMTLQEQSVNSVRATLSASRSSETSKSVMAVLTYMCSAVVRITGDLTFAEPSPSLTSWLLRSLPENRSDGFKLTDFVAADERERVGAFFRSFREVGVCIILKAFMVDGNNTRVAVHMHCSCVQDSETETGFIVGITQACDDSQHLLSTPKSWLYTVAEDVAARGGQMVEGGNYSGAGQTASPNAQADASLDHRRAHDHGISTSPITKTEEEVPFAVIDVSCETLPIMGCNDPFRQLAVAGGERAGSMSDLLHGGRSNPFTEQVHTILRDISLSLPAEGQRHEVQKVRFARPMPGYQSSSSTSREHYAEATCIIDTSELVAAKRRRSTRSTWPLRCEFYDVIVRPHMPSQNRAASRRNLQAAAARLGMLAEAYGAATLASSAPEDRETKVSSMAL
eukprot:TRINITY_DN10590_c0_g1_i1.p1 TRINITY_DN10590_c0_g1~~TRINITY_DN10590_c0_g1_i1.p1  ORF type:complete len:647 (+),score=49.52 TRINITY_DN10590_c0_g1_i1:149-2089(+)